MLLRDDDRIAFNINSVIDDFFSSVDRGALDLIVYMIYPATVGVFSIVLIVFILLNCLVRSKILLFCLFYEIK
jgi:hypothetical protein